MQYSIEGDYPMTASKQGCYTVIMTDPHVYTSKEVKHMREIAYSIAQKVFENNVTTAPKEQSYDIALLKYAESLAQTYIMAGVSPSEMNEALLEIKDS